MYTICVLLFLSVESYEKENRKPPNPRNIFFWWIRNSFLRYIYRLYYQQ